MKKVTSLAIMMCMILTMLIIPVNAYEYCCELSIDSIDCQDEKVIVNFTTNSTEDDRSIQISINRRYRNAGYRVYNEYITVPEGEQSVSREFDSSMFIDGEEYSISLEFEDRCEQDNCEWYESKSFILESGGMPVYELSDAYGEEITVGIDPIALKFTAQQDGIYTLFMDQVYESKATFGAVNVEGMSGLAYNMVYLKADEYVIYEVKSDKDDYNTGITESFAAKFKGDFVSVTTQDVLTINPNDGDAVFSITDLEVESAAKIQIPRSGKYEISTECEDDGYGILLDNNGKEVVWQGYNESGMYLLQAGTYYYISHPSCWGMSFDGETYELDIASYTTTITYHDIETLQFGEEITSNSYDSEYFTFTLDAPAILKKEDISGYVSVIVDLNDESKYLSDYAEVFPAGDYVLEYSGEGSTVITKTDIPIVTIGDDVSCYEDGERRFVVLKATETAEYEIHSSGSVYINNEYIYDEYQYINMNAGETVVVELYGNDSVIDVKKYQKTYTSVNLGGTDLNFARTQKAGVSFTAEEDNIYYVAFKNEYNWTAYFNEIKIYTDKKTLYEGKGAYIEPIEITLNKGETVYIDAVNGDWNSVNISNLAISGDTVVKWSVDDEQTKTLIYVPNETGYYKLTAAKASTDNDASFEVWAGNTDIGCVTNDNEQSTVAYASKDVPLRIKIEMSWGEVTDVKLTFGKAEAKTITDDSNFEITDNSYYSFVIPETGVYQITGSAYYEQTYWRDAGEYPYFFSPIIKDCKDYGEAYLSYDGETVAECPTFFCGNAGDEVLFKEESTSSGYMFNYPIKAKIAKVETETVDLNSNITSSENFKFYAVNVINDGIYKFEDLSVEGDYEKGNYGNGYTYFYDGNKWNDIGYILEENGGDYVTFELAVGTYYVYAGTYDWNLDDEYIPVAGFKISKAETEMSAVKSENSVTYSIAGTIPQNAILYIALYDGEKLMGIKQIEAPMSEGTIAFGDEIDGYICKLFLWDEKLKPFCQSITGE